MKKIIKLLFLNLLILCLPQVSLFAQQNLPLMQIGDLEYQGAYGIPSNQPNDLSANYSTGTIAYNPANNSLFVSGHEVYGTVGEFSIPALVNTKTNASALNQATLLQSFRPVLNEAATGNPQGIDKITGMAVINGKLIVNAEDRYDAGADNTHTTVTIENPSNIANSTVNGYYSFQGAAHAGGWMSPIPGEWQALLGGSYITGHSSRYSINGRYPMGITAFAFNPSNISGASGTIPTTTLLDFSLNNPLYAQYNSYVEPNYNLVTADLSVIGGNVPGVSGHTFADANATVGSNDLWTEVSQASYGFIVPGTRTYLTIGSSGGHNSGIGYKPTQNSGYECPGPCSYDAEDYYNYYWLWDVNDLLDVKNGIKSPHDIRPYDYGVFEALFRTEVNPKPIDIQQIAGGTFDANNGILYLSVYHGASTGQYQRLPAIVAYKINGSSGCTDADGDGVCADVDPNDNDPCIPNSCGGGECELLTNTNFDNNTNNWVDWGANVASVNGVANITNIISSTQPWEVGFIQSNIPMEQGENYTIKFRARADANRPLYVRVEQDGGQYTEYYATTVNLTTNMQDYTLNFTMNEATDNNANFIFYMGGNTTNTYIDNANLTKADCGSSCPQQGQSCQDGDDCTTGETYDQDCNCTGGTSQDADSDGVCAALDPNDNDPCVPNSCGGEECELLTNTNFDNNTNNWVDWGCNVQSVNGIANITNIISATSPWEVGFSQSSQNITLEQGETYTITFRARADGNRPLRLYVGMRNYPYTDYHLETFNLTTNMQVFSRTFTMDSPTDYNINFDFNFGGNRTNTYIDYAILEKADCGSFCPQQGQNCEDDDACTTGETYDQDCNCTGGTSQDADGDGVCAALDPDDNDPCVPNASNCGGGECELLPNGNFDNDLASWSYWGCNPALVNGMVRLTNIINGQNVWEAALYTDNILIEQGQSYEVKFSGRADANRTMDVKVGQNDSPWTDYLYETVNLTTSMRDFTFNFTMNRPTDYNTAFDFFVAGGNTANIYIDNVSLVKVNCDNPPPPPSGQCDCPDAAEPGNTRTVRNVSELRNALNQAKNQGGNMTIKVEPGVYQLSQGINIEPNMSNLTIMGTSGNRDDVFIKGSGAYGGVPYIFLVQTDNFTVAHLTLGEVSTHAIQIQAERDADDFTAINTRFVDVKEQLLKVSKQVGGPFSDNGRILCCEFEFTAGEAYQYYTGGIDAHRSKNWLVQNNVFKGIRSPDGTVAEHAIHFWQDCENITVIGNKIMDCDRGVGFGLSNDPAAGNRGGLIMNNFIHTNRDVGIGIEHSPNTKIYNNTVITDNYFNSIEYRFSATTNVQIANNLTSKNIASRDGGSATTPTNYTVSNFSIFADAANRDYHLVGRPSGIVDAGTPLSEVNVDIDCDNRNGGIDIGADEVTGAAKEDESLAPSFDLYPNPAHHTIQLSCEFSENIQAQIQIYDAFGKLVKHITEVELHTGLPTSVEVSQLPAGMYFCTLQSGEWQAVKKFVIAR